MYFNPSRLAEPSDESIRIDGAIGQTPMVRLVRIPEPGMAELWVKLEGMNPGGSIKDRTALGMILDAEEKGLLKPGGTIVEPTSGNTGVGLAQVASARGYRLILCLPSQMSEERKRTLEAYGAELVLTDPERRMLPCHILAHFVARIADRDVDAEKRDIVAELAVCLLQVRKHGRARCAPGGPEFHQYGNGRLQHRLFETGFVDVDRFVHSRP